MTDIVERLRFDATRCELQFSKGVAGNIEEAADEIERLRAALKPFSTQIELIECTTDHTYSDDETWPLEDCLAVKLGDLRRARDAIRNEQNGGKSP